MVAITSHSRALVAPAIYIGVQDGCGVVEDIALYNLTADIPGHPIGSTVSAQTLLAAGYRLPSLVLERPSPLPTAAKCPKVLCWREVVPHPAGGWTIACPVDATRSTVRRYVGRWSTHAAASAAMDSLV